MVEHDGCLRGFECHRYLILGRGPGSTLNFTSRNAGSGPPHGFTAAVTSWGFRLCSNQPSASHTCPLLGQAETDIPLLIHSRCGARCLAESCIFHPHRADGDGGGFDGKLAPQHKIMVGALAVVMPGNLLAISQVKTRT